MARHRKCLLFCMVAPLLVSHLAFADPDLVMCRKIAGVAVGKLCEKCDGRCVICDSHVRPTTKVHVCDECNFGTYQGRCIICGSPGYSDAYYCKECTQMEKDVCLHSARGRLHDAQITLHLFRCRGTDVRKLLILAQQRQICSTREKNMASGNSSQVISRCNKRCRSS
jgi:PHD finger-like domain-containing protein 5A